MQVANDLIEMVDFNAVESARAVLNPTSYSNDNYVGPPTKSAGMELCAVKFDGGVGSLPYFSDTPTSSMVTEV